MNMFMNPFVSAKRIAATVLLALAFTTPAFATLLDVTPGLPIIAFGSVLDQGLTYNATDGQLSLTAVPLDYQPTSSTMNVTAFSGASPQTLPSLQIGLTVDSTGAIVGPSFGNYFALSGTMGPYSGNLLTGTIDQFGFANITATTDAMNFVMNITGGSMMGLYGNKPVAIAVDLENSTFNGSFSQSFSSSRIKGTLGTVPAPPTPWLFVAGLPVMLGAIRWRRRARGA